jgi:hypothetical protein
VVNVPRVEGLWQIVAGGRWWTLRIGRRRGIDLGFGFMLTRSFEWVYLIPR